MVATLGWKGTCTKLSSVSLACQIVGVFLQILYFLNYFVLYILQSTPTATNDNFVQIAKLYSVTKLKFKGCLLQPLDSTVPYKVRYNCAICCLFVGHISIGSLN